MPGSPDAETPYVAVAARSTKNKKAARQHVQRDLAAALREHVSRKLPTASVFNMPKPELMASIVRGDLATARKQWIDAARHDPEELVRRQESDFLAEKNHAGETFDLHGFRHTCGAWLAQAGLHPKTIQAVMRHSTITLTMDTYGHLFPGQEADAVAKLPALLRTSPESLSATGTTGRGPAVVAPMVAPMVAPAVDIPCQQVTTADDSDSAEHSHRRIKKPHVSKGPEDSQGRLTTIAAKLPGLDSNQDEQNQNLLCYRYTTG